MLPPTQTPRRKSTAFDVPPDEPQNDSVSQSIIPRNDPFAGDDNTVQDEYLDNRGEKEKTVENRGEKEKPAENRGEKEKPTENHAEKDYAVNETTPDEVIPFQVLMR